MQLNRCKKKQKQTKTKTKNKTKHEIYKCSTIYSWYYIFKCTMWETGTSNISYIVLFFSQGTFEEK